MLRIILSNRWFTLLWAVSIMFTAIRFAGKDGAAEKAIDQANRRAPASQGESDGLTNQAAVLASQVLVEDSAGHEGDGHTMIRYPENSWARQQIAAQQQEAARARGEWQAVSQPVAFRTARSSPLVGRGTGPDLSGVVEGLIGWAQLWSGAPEA